MIARTPQAALTGVHTPAGSVCVQEFRDALNAVVLGREVGSEPEWFTEGLAQLQKEAGL